MKHHRCFHDFIILSTIPHFVSLYYTYEDSCYTAVVMIATMSSILWHMSRESSKQLLYLDYSCATLLCLYEIYKSQDIWFVVVTSNLGLLVINKSMDLLSKYKILRYSIGHSIYHVISCCKTFYIASYSTS